MSLPLREGERVLPHQVFGHGLVELLLVIRGAEFERQGPTLGVLNVLNHLTPEGSLAKVLEPVPQGRCIRSVDGVLRPEGVHVAENHVIQDCRKAEQFEQRVLQWRGGQAQRWSLQNRFCRALGYSDDLWTVLGPEAL